MKTESNRSEMVHQIQLNDFRTGSLAVVSGGGENPLSVVAECGRALQEALVPQVGAGDEARVGRHVVLGVGLQGREQGLWCRKVSFMYIFDPMQCKLCTLLDPQKIL